MVKFISVMIVFVLHVAFNVRADEANRIRPYEQNARYWQYKGEPVLLVGGSVDDNLFQLPTLELHLDEMVRMGANYIRNTMSARLAEGFEVQPYKQLDSGEYDLTQLNPEYWQRFERMLKLTEERDVIVQVELWAFHDFNREAWLANPWRPINNINYDEDGVLLENAPFNVGNKTHPFFATVKKLNNEKLILSYQKQFVDKILSYSLAYDHVLYCITNEIHPNYDPQWGYFWANYIREKANELDKTIEITEMYWQIDLKAQQHQSSLDHPEIYTFFEASQNSAKSGQENWDNLQFVWHYLSKQPRPINNVKIYGSSKGPDWSKANQDGMERFWRNLIGGSASSRFHRPPYGLGLNELAKSNIKSFRLLQKEFDFFNSQPNSSLDLLKNRDDNEAYMTQVGKEQIAVYFPKGGEVSLDLGEFDGMYRMKWLDILQSTWGETMRIKGDKIIKLETLDDKPWICLIRK